MFFIPSCCRAFAASTVVICSSGRWSRDSARKWTCVSVFVRASRSTRSFVSCVVMKGLFHPDQFELFELSNDRHKLATDDFFNRFSKSRECP